MNLVLIPGAQLNGHQGTLTVCIHADDTFLFSDIWKQLFFISEHKSDIQLTVDFRKEWLADFNTQVVLFDLSQKYDAIDTTACGFILDGQLPFKILDLSFSSTLVLDS